MILFRKIISIALLFFIFSCVSNLQKLAMEENRMKREKFYTSYLALEYLQYSRSLLQNDDYLNAQYFAKKGLDVSKGYKVILENPRFWGVNPDELEDLITAQKRYERVSVPKMEELLPIQMAHLTFLYDCWVTKEIKPAFRYGELNRCKDRFYQLLDEIEYFARNYGRENGPKVKIVEAIFERYLVLFDWDKYKINSKANKQMVRILNIIDEWDGDYAVVLLGNADRSGKNLYNERLALKRAQVVKQYLRKNGVPEELIELRVQGEEFPDLVTKDRVRQQFNRTTQVYLVKGRKSVRDIPLPVLYNKTYKQEIERQKKKKGLK